MCDNEHGDDKACNACLHIARALDAARLEGLKAAEAAVQACLSASVRYGSCSPATANNCLTAIRSLMTDAPKEE